MRVLGALLFGLVAATSSATAQPGGDYRVPYGHHERHAGQWVRLGTPTPTRFESEHFLLGRDAGWFGMLRIDRVWGTVHVRQIRLVRGNFVETINVNARLDRFHPSTYINLGRPRLVDEIVVVVNPYKRGAYAVFGSSAAPRPEIGAR